MPPYTFNNPVTSFLTTTHGFGGIPVVVNTAGVGDGSAFGPGYVARYVLNGRVYTVGEGTGWEQSFDGFSDTMNEWVWGDDMEEIIAKCKCQ